MIALFILFLFVNDPIDIEAQLNRKLEICLARAELESKPNYTRCYLEHVILRKKYGLPDPKELPPMPAKSTSPR